MSFRLCLPALACLLALAACQPTSSPRKESSALVVSSQQISPSVEVRWVEAVGQLEGVQDVEVRARVSGRLAQRLFEEGTRVQAGQALFRIDDGQRRSEHAAFRAATEEARARLEQARADRGRLEALVLTDAVSRKQAEDARSAERLALAQLESAQAREEQARLELEWMTVRSPVAGVAGRALVNPGGLVVADNTLLTRLTQDDALRVSFAVAQRELDGIRLAPGVEVKLMPEATGEELVARLDYVSPRVSEETGTVELRARLKQAEGLRAGQFVRVRLPVGQWNEAYRVPQRALLQRPDGTYAVYVAREGKAELRPVQVGPWSGKDWIVTEGLSPSDQVIVDQVMRLKHGAAISTSAPK